MSSSKAGAKAPGGSAPPEMKRAAALGGARGAKSETSRHHDSHGREDTPGGHVPSSPIVARGERKQSPQAAWRARNPQAAWAHDALKSAIRRGIVTRQPCAVCGAPEAEGHHEDYARPADVLWLCPAHHAAEHARMRRRKKGGVA